MILRVPGTKNSILTLERSLAHRWPYDPKYKDVVQHPSRVFFADCDYIHLSSIRARVLALALPKVEAVAEEVLKNHDVKHLEVQVIKVSDHDHSRACMVCEWLYYTDYSDGYLVGWYAVIKSDNKGEKTS